MLCQRIIYKIKIMIISEFSTASTEVPPTEETSTAVTSTVVTDTDSLGDCLYQGTTYTNGQSVETIDPCTECLCIEKEVVCATRECYAPGQNCTVLEQSENECCPTKYDCGKFFLKLNCFELFKEII